MKPVWVKTKVSPFLTKLSVPGAYPFPNHSRIELDDTQVLAVIDTMIKQRKDSVEQFRAGGREDLVAKESAEIGRLTEYLPAQLSDAELDAMIKDAIAGVDEGHVRVVGAHQGRTRPLIGPCPGSPGCHHA